MPDRSLTTILYFPGLRVLTLILPFFSVIVKPGPSTALSVGVAAEAEATATSAAASSATSASRVRNIFLLREWWFRPPAKGMVATTRGRRARLRDRPVRRRRDPSGRGAART